MILKFKARSVIKLLIVLLIVPINYLSELIIHFSHGLISQSNTFNNVFLGMTFNGIYTKEESTLSTTVFGLSIPIIFNIIYGSYIYKDLQLNNIYYFVRFKNRKKWFLGSVSRLILSAVWYCLFWISFNYCLSLCNTESSINNENLRIVSICFLTVLSYTIITTMAVNIFSFFVGTATAFIIVYIIIFGLFYLSLRISEITFWGININISKFNIVDNTILTWKNELCFQDLSVNLLYIFILIFILLLLTENTDIGLKDKESY